MVIVCDRDVFVGADEALASRIQRLKELGTCSSQPVAELCRARPRAIEALIGPNLPVSARPRHHRRSMVVYPRDAMKPGRRDYPVTGVSRIANA